MELTAPPLPKDAPPKEAGNGAQERTTPKPKEKPQDNAARERATQKTAMGKEPSLVDVAQGQLQPEQQPPLAKDVIDAYRGVDIPVEGGEPNFKANPKLQEVFDLIDSGAEITQINDWWDKALIDNPNLVNTLANYSDVSEATYAQAAIDALQRQTAARSIDAQRVAAESVKSRYAGATEAQMRTLEPTMQQEIAEKSRLAAESVWYSFALDRARAGNKQFTALSSEAAVLDYAKQHGLSETETQALNAAMGTVRKDLPEKFAQESSGQEAFTTLESAARESVGAVVNTISSFPDQKRATSTKELETANSAIQPGEDARKTSLRDTLAIKLRQTFPRISHKKMTDAFIAEHNDVVDSVDGEESRPDFYNRNGDSRYRTIFSDLTSANAGLPKDQQQTEAQLNASAAAEFAKRYPNSNAVYTEHGVGAFNQASYPDVVTNPAEDADPLVAQASSTIAAIESKAQADRTQAEESALNSAYSSLAEAVRKNPGKFVAYRGDRIISRVLADEIISSGMMEKILTEKR